MDVCPLESSSTNKPGWLGEFCMQGHSLPCFPECFPEHPHPVHINLKQSSFLTWREVTQQQKSATKYALLTLMPLLRNFVLIHPISFFLREFLLNNFVKQNDVQHFTRRWFSTASQASLQAGRYRPEAPFGFCSHSDYPRAYRVQCQGQPGLSLLCASTQDTG